MQFGQARTFSPSSPKAVVAILVGVLLFILVVGFVVIRFTSSAADAADTVFATIATRGADAAWHDASPDFREAVSEPRFAAFVAAHRLSTFRSATWSRRSVRGESAYLAGSVTLGGTTPRARIVLEHRGDGWRLGALSILDGSAAGLP